MPDDDSESNRIHVSKDEESPHLGNHLLEKFGVKENLLPQPIWDQLSRLSRRPKPDIRSLPSENDGDPLKNTHAGDELEMCDITNTHFDKIKTFLIGEGQDEQSDTLKQELLTMILLSDIGKAGGEYVPPSAEDPVVARLYIDLFLDGRHGAFIREDNTGWTQGLSESVKTDRLNFLHSPIAVSLEAGRKVALLNRGDISEEDINKRFSLTPEEQDLLTRLGFPPDRTPMIEFFTKAHIQEGTRFLLSSESELSEDQKKTAIFAMGHHFSLVVPKEFIDMNITDPTVYKMIAYTEVLDRFHGFLRRSKKTVGDSFSSARSVIEDNFLISRDTISSLPVNIEGIYKEVLSFFETTIVSDMKKQEASSAL